MQHLLEEHVPTEDLKKFETRYQTELNGGQVSTNAQFDYAWCLIRSKYPSDIRKGILLLEDLCRVSVKCVWSISSQMLAFFKKTFSWKCHKLDSDISRNMSEVRTMPSCFTR